MKILLTGGTGFIGRAVTRELHQREHDVVVLTRGAAGTIPVGDLGGHAKMVSGDLTDAAAMAELIETHSFDGICHLGGLTGIRDSYTRPTAYFDVNVGGTANLLKALHGRYSRTGACTSFVFASSRAVYARTGSARIAESQLAAPSDPYGVTKRSAEQLLEFETSSGVLGTTILRCFNVSGAAPGIVDSDADRLVPRLIGAITGELPPVHLISPASLLDFVHVIDIGRAFALAMENTGPGRYATYNVGTGSATSIAEVVALFERVSGKPIPMEDRPADISADRTTCIADISLIRAELDWSPERDITAIVHDAWHFASGKR
jgi:UDP-glucose 4-epimerase